MAKRKNRNDTAPKPAQEEVATVRSPSPLPSFVDRLHVEYRDEERQRRGSSRQRSSEGVSCPPCLVSLNFPRTETQADNCRPSPRADNVAHFPIHPPADDCRGGFYFTVTFCCRG